MRGTFDPAKRDNTLAERGLDFADAAFVFADITVAIEDTRENNGETRVICLWPPASPDGCRGLHAAWRGSPHLQHEESR